MKKRFSTSASRRVTFVTCLVVAAVLLLNIGVTALFGNRLLSSDMTKLLYRTTRDGRGFFVDTGLYSLVDDTKKLLSLVLESANEGRDEPVQVEIIFCADPDLLMGNDEMRPIYYTARLLAREFPESIRVRTTDVWKNPSSVDEFRTTSYSSIYQTNVIISSGTEFRIRPIRAFYAYESAELTEPWAYNGEKAFVKDILAVTRAESPICCLTTNHGEAVTGAASGNYTEFLSLLKNAGYEVRYLDLAAEAIPENCRLIISLGPTSDFSGVGADSEIRKLDAFLGQTYSFLLFADADTPYLPNLEEYLEEWGIRFDRDRSLTGLYQAIDPARALEDGGETFYAVYPEAGQGASLFSDLRRIGGEPKIRMGNVLSISYSPSYATTYVMEDTDAGTPAFSYGYYYSNGRERDLFDLFLTGKDATAVAKANGTPMTDDKGALLTKTDAPFRTAVLSTESRTVAEGQGLTNVNEASYVSVIGSLSFAENASLSTNAYGNADALLALLRGVGQEILPVGLNVKALYDPTVGTNSQSGESFLKVLPLGQSGSVWFLVLLPTICVAGTGTVLLIRRRRRH